MIQDCTAIILAGGLSTRMGRDKANVLLGEKTLLQHVIATMQAVFPQVIISVQAARPDIALRQIIDEQSKAGPLAGLAASLKHIATPWAFVVACDMPFLSVALIEFLAQFRNQNQAIVPLIQGHAQPLAAFYARDILPVIETQLASGGKNSLRAVLAQLQTRYITEAELLNVDANLHGFFDLDTPQDVIIAKQKLAILNSH